jgi:uncharacterized membrane protein
MLKQRPTPRSFALRGYTISTMYSKTRLEALSDAIFAIVMTLLVLELKVPINTAPGHLAEALRQDKEAWLAFLITFCIAARYWMLQHDVFHLTERFTHHAVILTFAFLGFVTVLPFSSSLIGTHGSEPLAVFLYCLNQAAIGGALIAKLEFLRIRDHIPASADMRYIRGRLYTLTGSMAAASILIWIVPLKYIMIIPIVIITLGRRVLFRRPKA